MMYTASANETFDKVALDMYGDEKYAHVLISANPELCHKIAFTGGEVLTVPELDETECTAMPPWKRGQ